MVVDRENLAGDPWRELDELEAARNAVELRPQRQRHGQAGKRTDQRDRARDANIAIANGKHCQARDDRHPDDQTQDQITRFHRCS